ncbi:hypothetical protein UO65_0129 [Actinokineospora spheciospongiae]|uniref:Uncharacterized protein n=1 Tax=Actinokineospora spheciospongiae TaxID=909613 RepID=W7J683_9PSEU|nr:hypothetical protein UO65_0129 [Actinokineospora spheciospongiae]
MQRVVARHRESLIRLADTVLDVAEMAPAEVRQPLQVCQRQTLLGPHTAECRAE